MKIPATPYLSPLGRLQPKTADLEAVKRTGWQRERLLVVSPEDPRLDFVERELVRRIGERLYGGKHG